MKPRFEAPVLPEGCGPKEALVRLLTAFRREAPEVLVLQGPREALLAELERHGLLGRWTRLDSREVKRLPLPSLLVHPGGGYCLVTEGGRGHVTVGGLCGGQVLPFAALATGIYLDLAPTLPDGGLWQRIGKQLLSHRKALVPILGAALLAQLLGFLAPQFTRILVDQVFPEGARSKFFVVLAASTFLAFYRAWVTWVQSRFELFLETRLGYVIEQGLMAHLLRLPYLWLSGRTIGDLLQGFYGLGTAKDFLTGQVLTSLLGSLAAVGYLAMLLNTLTGAALWVAGTTLVCVGMTILVGRRVAKLQTIAIAAQVKERGFLVEVLNGVAVIKASGAETRAERMWMSLVRRRRGLDLKSQQVSLGATGLLELVQALLSQALTIWGGYQVLHGGLRLGEMLAFTMMASSFQQAIAQAGNLYLQLVMMNPQLEKVREILETPTEPVPPLCGPKGLCGPIRIQDACFRYNFSVPWVFENLNLVLEPGERVVLRGPSGCGKSTLLKLVANLYAPEKGRISFGGLSPAQAKALVAYLPQFVHLFHGSILENLRLFSGGASRKLLMATAATTGLDKLVAALPLGYETPVSPGGGNFSGGQRQLIALTAVVASSRQVLLLDEAMANLDPLTREQLFRSGIFHGRTVLLASHEDAQGERGPEQHGFRRIVLSDGPRAVSRIQ
jgi:ABC-type bacteriocin/lantibiotic exporter with double-glycine peptidase domain